MRLCVILLVFLIPGLATALDRDDDRFGLRDIFELEWASDPQISPTEALVRIPGASHRIAARLSQLMAKVAHIVKWFEIYGEETDN